MTSAWVDFGGAGGARVSRERRPIRVGVIANLSACTGCTRWRETFAARFADVDRDCFDALFEQIGPHLRFELLGGSQTDFRMKGFGDFRPEILAASVPWTEALLRARAVAGEPAALVAALQRAGVAVEPASRRPAAAAGAASPPSDGMLDEVLVARERRRSDARSDLGLSTFLKEVAEASSDGRDHLAIARVRAEIDQELARNLSVLLRDPQLQALEGAWRSLRDLVFRLPDDRGIQVQVLDVARQDLLAEIAVGLPIEATKLHRLCVESPRSTGQAPFEFLIVDFEFGDDDDDARLLSHLGAIGRRCGARVFAGVRPELADTAAAGKLATDPCWRERRTDDDALAVHLVTPRVLARLPYGQDTDPVDGFAFEEISAERSPASYCWRNPAHSVVCGLLVAGDAQRGIELGDLPMHVLRSGGEPTSVGPLERLWTEREIARVTEAGLLPLVGARGSDVARLRLPQPGLAARDD